MSIEARSALISTASVEIKTLTLNGKQMTLAVFRQLPEGGLIDWEGYLQGDPWGHVNYHPGPCRGFKRRHLHVVFQRDGRLLRDRVTFPDRDYPRPNREWLDSQDREAEEERHERHLKVRRKLWSDLPQLFIAV